MLFFFFFKQKTAYEMRISDWSSDVCSSDLAAQKHDELARLDGAAFDRAYVANEVAYHATVNGALRDLLIPSATNGDLKSLLETGLTLFGEHQKHAEHLATSLQ